MRELEQAAWESQAACQHLSFSSCEERGPDVDLSTSCEINRFEDRCGRRPGSCWCHLLAAAYTMNSGLRPCAEIRRHVVDTPVHLPALMFDRGAGLAEPAIVLPFGR
jgi:hypothetical protein